MITERWTEVHALLGAIHAVSVAAETHIGYAYMRDYNRGIVVVDIGVMTGNLQVRVREAMTANGGSAQLIATKTVNYVAGTDNADTHIIEIRAEEITPDYDWLRVEVIPVGGAVYSSVQLYGCDPRYAAVTTTGYGSITA